MVPDQLHVRGTQKDKINRELLKVIDEFEPDFMIVVGGYWLDSEIMNKINCKTVSFQIDDPYSQKLNIFPRIPILFDLNFTTCLKFVAEYKRHGIECRYLPFGFSSDFNKTVKFENKNIDVSFIGTPFKMRQPFLQKISEMREKYGLKIVIAGANRDYYTIKNRVDFDEAAKIISRSKICVNFADQPDGFLGAKNRVPEIAGSRSLLLTQEFPERESYFDDSECVTFNTVEEMEEKIIYYLLHGDKIKKISENGYKKAKKTLESKILAKRIVEEIKK